MISILPISLEIVPFVAELHKKCFTKNWSERSFSSLISNSSGYGFYALMEKEVIGFVFLRKAADEIELYTICTIEKMRKRGVGTTLLKTAIVKAKHLGAKKIFLEVAENNHGALPLYKKLGFEIVGKREKYYQSESGQVNAFIMSLQLENSSSN